MLWSRGADVFVSRGCCSDRKLFLRRLRGSAARSAVLRRTDGCHSLFCAPVCARPLPEPLAYTSTPSHKTLLRPVSRRLFFIQNTTRSCSPGRRGIRASACKSSCSARSCSARTPSADNTQGLLANPCPLAASKVSIPFYPFSRFFIIRSQLAEMFIQPLRLLCSDLDNNLLFSVCSIFCLYQVVPSHGNLP